MKKHGMAKIYFLNKISIFIFAAISIAIASPAGAKIYKFLDYLFYADLPKGSIVCESTPPAPNPGFSMLLEPGNCDDSYKKPTLSFFAVYNVLAEHRTTVGLAQKECDDGQAIQTSVMVDTLKFYRCKHKKDNIYKYFSLRQQKDVWFGSWFIYEIDIYNNGNKKYDEEYLKKIMKRIHLIPYSAAWLGR
jgi:hypothetical protein